MEGERTEGTDSPVAKTYHVIVAKRIYTYVGVPILILLLLIPALYFKYPQVAVVCIILFLAFGLLLKKYAGFFAEQKAIELFKDKLIVTGKEITEINFSDIKDYNIAWTRSNGVALTVALKNKDKIKLLSNKSLSGTEGLGQFVTDFDQVMRSYIADGSIQIKKKKPFIESPVFIGLLVANAALALLGFGMSIYFKTRVPTYALICLSISAFYFSMHYYQRKKSREINS